MKQNIFRIVLTALAFVTLFAGSINLTQTNASEVAPGAGLCNTTCGCTPGPNLCCESGGVTCYGI
jgi:hypothetical protein